MSFIVHTTKHRKTSVGFAVGLHWVIIQPSKKVGPFSGGKSAALRKQGAAVRASRYTSNPLKLRENIYGFFSEPPGGVGKTKAKRIYSLSALLLQTLRSAGAADGSSLVLMIPPQLPNKRVLILVEDGYIVLDALVDPLHAIDQIKERLTRDRQTRFFSEQDETEFPSTPISWEDVTGLLDAKKPGGLLTSMPSSPLPLIGAGAVLLAAVGYYAHLKINVEPDARMKAMLAQMQKDKTPAYLAAFDSELANAGWERGDLLDQVKYLGGLPVFVGGWSAESIECDTSGCRSQWKRLGGTIDDLAKGLTGESVDRGVAELNTAISSRSFEVKRAQFPRERVTSRAQALEQIAPLFQRFNNAGIATTIGEPQRWAGFALEDVRPDATYWAFSVEMNVPFFQVAEVVQALPESVQIRSLSLKVGKDDMKATIKGIVYVK